jgi:hypothetical protein
MSLSLVELKQPSLSDVPASLRELADQIERGDVPPSVHCIVVSELEEGEIELYGYGAVGLRSTEVGLLQMAVLKMACM